MKLYHQLLIVKAMCLWISFKFGTMLGLDGDVMLFGVCYKVDMQYFTENLYEALFLITAPLYVHRECLATVVCSVLKYCLIFKYSLLHMPQVNVMRM